MKIYVSTGLYGLLYFKSSHKLFKAKGNIHSENWPSQSPNKIKLLKCTNEESER